MIRDRPIEDEAEERIYRDEQGKIGLPPEMLFSCLVNAGRNVKNGKKQISTATTTTLPDFLSILDTFLPLPVPEGCEEAPWKIDKRRGVNKETGGALCVVRPRFDQWSFGVTIDFDEKKIDQGMIKLLFNNAGSSQGLGGFRPNRKGPFGRFRVVGWEVVDAEQLEEKAA